jgi:uncharacterized protein (TIGR03437 family)
LKLLIRNALVVLAITLPVAALADVSGTQTLSSGSNLNLDTGAIVTSGGDLAWNGTALKPQGSATAVDAASTQLGSLYSGANGYNTLVSEGSTLINTYANLLGAYLSPSAFTPAVNDILVVHTNGGNYSALLVTAIGSSITLEFHTFTGSTTTTPPATGPTITSLQNNYGNILPGLPSYGIAPASLFVIYGTGMSAPGTPVLQSSAAPGLQTTLNNTSISVTVGSVTTKPFIYYTSPTQIAAVLPSTTPAGTGTITVTYNGTASAPANIVVTPSAFGIDTLYGTGSGGIVATDNTTGSVIVPTASASPGEVLTIWGSGVGADTANNDSTYPQKSDNLQKTYNVQVYIGGVAANVVYAGRSQYPGVDQVDITVPTEAAGLLVGCNVSVVVIASGIDSNFGTLPINPGGGVCADPALGITGTQIGQTGSQTTVKTGSVSLFQETSPAAVTAARPIPQAQSLTTTYTADASFTSETGYSYIGGSSFYSIGSCIVSEVNDSSTTTTTGTSTGLDAGTPIVLTGGGLSVNLPEAGTTGPEVGEYYATLTNPLIGGTAYTFTGPGGTQVGPFTVTLTLPVPLTWTNEQSISTVTESQGQLITWSGGASGSLVFISGSSSSIDFSASVSFTCIAPVAEGQFTVPSYVLSALPKSTNGSLGVFNFASPVSFTATGIDSGTASTGVLSSENVTYQ